MNQQTKKTSTKKVRKSFQNQITVDIDLGDKWSHYCILDDDSNVVEEGRFRTVARSVEKQFQNMPPARIALEAGTHSI